MKATKLIILGLFISSVGAQTNNEAAASPEQNQIQPPQAVPVPEQAAAQQPPVLLRADSIPQQPVPQQLAPEARVQDPVPPVAPVEGSPQVQMVNKELEFSTNESPSHAGEPVHEDPNVEEEKKLKTPTDQSIASATQNHQTAVFDADKSTKTEGKSYMMPAVFVAAAVAIIAFAVAFALNEHQKRKRKVTLERLSSLLSLSSLSFEDEEEAPASEDKA